MMGPLYPGGKTIIKVKSTEKQGTPSHKSSHETLKTKFVTKNFVEALRNRLVKVDCVEGVRIFRAPSSLSIN